MRFINFFKLLVFLILSFSYSYSYQVKKCPPNFTYYWNLNACVSRPVSGCGYSLVSTKNYGTQFGIYLCNGYIEGVYKESYFTNVCPKLVSKNCKNGVCTHHYWWYISSIKNSFWINEEGEKSTSYPENSSEFFSASPTFSSNFYPFTGIKEYNHLECYSSNLEQPVAPCPKGFNLANYPTPICFSREKNFNHSYGAYLFEKENVYLFGGFSPYLKIDNFSFQFCSCEGNKCSCGNVVSPKSVGISTAYDQGIEIFNDKNIPYIRFFILGRWSGGAIVQGKAIPIAICPNGSHYDMDLNLCLSHPLN